MFKKILIANRGEIVRRVIKTCCEMGIKTVAVYSDADKDAFYLNEADEAYNIGPANPVKSYLNVESIIEVIKKSAADAVHPGYGFLSENYNFANAVMNSGAVWIGPSPEVMQAVESKCYCREIATSVDVPIIPGTIKPFNELEELHEAINEIGLPVMLKLDQGGGGKGIEAIHDISQAREVWESVSRIGLAAFSSSNCYIESQVVQPRHIEVQFIVDKTGKCVCLGERECSIQRKHQKIIEESPSPVVKEEDRQALYENTQNLAVAMGYEGAGTIEYLRSVEGNYFFMEVNARLQVEHPVSEFLTGLDIVEKQIKIAAGEPLAIKQEDLVLEGHAIEARVYAEDPVSFVPSPGVITGLSFPDIDGRHLRIDHAITEGTVVVPYYDPLIAKIITWGENRKEAIALMEKALTDTRIEGIKTTLPLNLQIMQSKDYRDGNFDTSFIEKLFNS